MTSANLFSRRKFLTNSTAAIAAWSAGRDLLAGNSTAAEGVTFSFGTYGMKSLRVEQAVRAVAEIGYDGVELAALPDWDSHPGQLSQSRRQELRALIHGTGLQLTALSHNLRPSDDDSAHARDLEKLKRIIALGHTLSPDDYPVLQGIFGGGKWEDQKTLYVKRMEDWARLAMEEQTVICIKPHRGSAMSRPAEAAWIIQQLGEPPWMRMVYDYSHYAFRDMSIEQTVRNSLKYTGHIAVKDTIRKGDSTTFVLPGESGNFDYEKLFSLFYKGGYRGDISCEVSSAVWRQAGYDPLTAASTCYQNIAPVLARAGVPRRT